MANEGYFTNLMNDRDSSLDWDGLGSQPEEQHQPSVDNTPAARTNQKRGKSFSQKEDRLLVSAWLNVSKDPIRGTNQTNGAFWKRVIRYYYDYKDFDSERTQSSLMHRWHHIQEQVNKFCGCHSQIERRRQSGVSIEDRIGHALTLFKAEDKENRSFQLMHCWNILRNEPKWHEKMQQLASQNQHGNKKQKASEDPSPDTDAFNNGDTTNNNTCENGPPPETNATKRPPGKKRAKESMRRGDACADALDRLWEKKMESDAEKEKKKDERYTQSYELEKERLQIDRTRALAEQKKAEIKEAEVQLKRMMEEERIMTMDLTPLPPSQQQFYKSLQDEISARRASMNNSG